MTLSRRSFIATGSLLVLVGLGCSPGSDRAVSEDDVLGPLVALGRRVIDVSDNPRELVASTLAGAGGTDLMQVQAAVRDDFIVGRVLVVDGWLLSRTECALAAISADSSLAE